MPVNPISGTGPVQLPAGISGVGRPGQQPQRADFGDMLKKYVDRVDDDQQNSAGAIKDYLSGKNKDILPVVSAVAEADLSFKLLLGVRNKVLDAYKQTMNMNL